MLSRLLVAVLAAGALVVVAPAAGAWAGGGGSWVTCTKGEAGCEVGATNSQTTGPKHSTKTSNGARSCKDWMGAAAPCYDKVFGWMGSDGCYYKQIATPNASIQAVFGGVSRDSGSCPQAVVRPAR